MQMNPRSIPNLGKPNDLAVGRPLADASGARASSLAYGELHEPGSAHGREFRLGNTKKHSD
jgi:hypothetical protein